MAWMTPYVTPTARRDEGEEGGGEEEDARGGESRPPPSHEPSSRPPSSAGSNADAAMSAARLGGDRGGRNAASTSDGARDSGVASDRRPGGAATARAGSKYLLKGDWRRGVPAASPSAAAVRGRRGAARGAVDGGSRGSRASMACSWGGGGD
jgi:hypothetical protein